MAFMSNIVCVNIDQDSVETLRVHVDAGAVTEAPWRCGTKVLIWQTC